MKKTRTKVKYVFLETHEGNLPLCCVTTCTPQMSICRPGVHDQTKGGRGAIRVWKRCIIHFCRNFTELPAFDPKGTKRRRQMWGIPNQRLLDSLSPHFLLSPRVLNQRSIFLPPVPSSQLPPIKNQMWSLPFHPPFQPFLSEHFPPF